MKLFYIANIRMPSERAHSVQVMHMCSALVARGVEVTLLVPNRATTSADPFVYYGLPPNFLIEKVNVLDLVRFGTVGFLIESLMFAFRATRRVGREPDALIYTREELPLLFLPRLRAFYEAHQIRRSPLFKWAIGRAKGIIAISQGLTTVLSCQGFPRGRILVAHDGYDASAFEVRVDKREARQRLLLPQDSKIALYIGGLERWKGAEVLCNAEKLLAEHHIKVVVIGGTEAEVERFRTQYPGVIFLGSRPYRELAVNQQVADVLVIPNSGREQISREFTSPLKLFAHLASKIPIVASRLPSLCEVLSETTAYLVTPDDPRALAEGIARACREADESRAKAEKAEVSARMYSWDARAKAVLEWIK